MGPVGLFCGWSPTEQPRQVLAHIIEPRVEEIFSLVHRSILDTGYGDLLASGLVVTGGTSQLEGIIQAAEQVTGMPVRLGQPFGLGGMKDMVANPIYATGAGLVNYGRQFSGEQRGIFQSRYHGRSSMLEKMTGWFKEMF